MSLTQFLGDYKIELKSHEQKVCDVFDKLKPFEWLDKKEEEHTFGERVGIDSIYKSVSGEKYSGEF